MCLTSDEQKILAEVKEIRELEPYFFEKLMEKKEVKWLEPLKSNGFFDQTNIPQDIQGYSQEWLILKYVKSIVGQTTKDQLEIIKEVLIQTAEIAHDNYRVVRQTIEVLSIIPSIDYDVNYIQHLLNYWLKGKYNRYCLQSIIYILYPVVTEADKLFLIFKSVLAKILESNTDEFLIENLYKKNDVIKRLTKDEFFINTTTFIIELLEKKISKNLLSRRFEDLEFTIQMIDENLVVKCNEAEIINHPLVNRKEDTYLIIKTIGEKFDTKDEIAIDRFSKLLYEDLFSGECYESIFREWRHLIHIEDYLILLLRNIIKENTDRIEELQLIINGMLKSRYCLTIKNAIYIICNNYSGLLDYFLKTLEEEPDIIEFIIRYYIFADEIKHLFENFSDLNQRQIEIIEDSIEKGEYIDHEWFTKGDRALWKQMRYKALKNNAHFYEKYRSLKNLTGKDPELTPPIQFSGAHWIEQKSSLSKNQIVNMSNDELIKEIISFKPKENFEMFSEESYRGLGEVLAVVIKENPERFTNELDKFIIVPYEIMASIIDTFKEIINDKVTDVRRIIEFFNEYCSQPSFWEDTYCYCEDKSRSYTHITVLKRMGRYLQAYISNDKLLFDVDVYNSLINIFNISLNKFDFVSTESDLFKNNDYGLYTINSFGGIFAEVILELALKIKRVGLEGYDSKWNIEIKLIYEDLLARKSIDAYFIFGEYIGYFAYIDKKWTLEKIESITLDDPIWEFFMSGYLYGRTVYDDFYKIMGVNYLHALSYRFTDKDMRKRLIGHITLGYLNGFEDNSTYKPFNEMLKQWNIDDINEVISFCFGDRNKDKSNEIAQLNMLNFWNLIRQKYSSTPVENMNQSEIELIQHSVHMITNFDYLNDSIEEDLIFCFGFLRGNLNDYYIVDFIKNQINKDDQNERLKGLIIEFFKKCTPSYPEEEILRLLDYIKDKTDELKEIRDIYKNPYTRSFVVEHIVKLLN